MKALRWLWDFGIPAAGAVSCFVAMLWSLLIADDPAHVWLAYLLGFAWFAGALTEALHKVNEREGRW